MKIAILDLCIWLPQYQYDQDKFGVVLSKWLARGLPEAQFTIFDLVEGDPLPDISAFDGFLLGGSEQGVYDNPPWMQPLRDWLPKARDAGKALFGVCFGHQIMADVFGGRAEKVSDYAVGVRKFELNGTEHTGHVWHRDQVTEVPPGATVIGKSDYCPVAALSYDFPAMSVQFHPEYSADYVATFIDRSRGDVLSNENADKAIADFGTSNVSPDLFAQEAAAFFKGAIAG